MKIGELKKWIKDVPDDEEVHLTLPFYDEYTGEVERENDWDIECFQSIQQGSEPFRHFIVAREDEE